MKIIKLDQRSPEWHDWRNGKDIDGPRITASNIAVIAGISPFKSRVTLWEEMTGRKAPDPMNPAMAHGVKTEDEALAAWIQDYGDYAQPCCIEQEEHPWIAASASRQLPWPVGVNYPGRWKRGMRGLAFRG